MPEYTGRVMERIPDFIPLWTLVLGGIYWVSHRRDEVAEAEAEEQEWGWAMKFKLTLWRVYFYCDHGPGLYSSYIRYFHGLGAATNMTDQFPWGLWIGFDCLCGVMLAAGGFCMVGAVYLFNVERLHPVVRPAVLTAFLGYLLLVWDCCLTWGGRGSSGTR